MLLDTMHPEAALGAPAFATLIDHIRSHRQDYRETKKIDRATVDLMKQAGVYRAMVSKHYGGWEWSPADFFRMVEEISRADGSAGWVASFGVAAVYLAALPLGTLDEIYANGPDVAYAGGNFPSQKVKRTPDGLLVNGRWGWGSGCSGADLIGVGIEVEDDNGSIVPLLGTLPRSKVTIEENWNVNGMRGTGSFDLVVKDVIMPERWAFVRGAKASLDGPLYRYPVMALSSQALSVVALGIARAAIDELVAIAAGRSSLIGGPSFANRPSVQAGLAKAEAELRSARAFFYESAEEAFDRISAGEDIDEKSFAMLRIAATHAAHASAGVAHSIYTLAGTTGIYAGNPIGQALQDAIIIPQHAFLSEATWQTWGAALLGVEMPGSAAVSGTPQVAPKEG